MPVLRNVFNDVIACVKDDSIYQSIMPFLVFTELIYQFQSNEVFISSSFYKKKFQKSIIEFKDISLLPIFEYSQNMLLSLFQHQIKTENMEDFIFYINEVIKCLNECLDYEEDLNSKEDNYSKFEIKPVYIPNNKRRTRDKTLDIDVIASLVQNIFDTYLILIKASIQKELCAPCLKLLQKLFVMKVMYLGDGKYQILKLFQDGICNILFSKNGNYNHESLCKLIYCMKKNHSFLELLSNDSFFNYLFTFTNETFENTKTESSYMNGFIYLMRFLAYFSHQIKQPSFGLKEVIRQYICNLCPNVLTQLNFNNSLSEDINQFEDLSTTFGMCGECCYVQLLEKISDILKDCDLKNDLKKKVYCINFGFELIKNNYHSYLDDKMTNINDNEVIHFSIQLNEASDESKEINGIINYIVRVFDIIKEVKTNGIGTNSFYNLSILKFIKFFIKNFLSSYLSNKFMIVLSQINESLKLNSSSEFLIFLLDIITQISVEYAQKETLISLLVIKTLKHLEKNMKNESGLYEQNQTLTILLGKIHINKDELVKVLDIQLKKTMINYQLPLKLHKKLLYFLFYVYQLTTTNSIEPYLPFFYNEITKDIREENLSYMLNGMIALVKSLNNQINYELTVEKIMPFIRLNYLNYFISSNTLNDNSIQILHLLNDITKNKKNRVYFSSTSQCPYNLITLSKELLCHYYKIAKEISIKNEEDKYRYQILPISLFTKILYNMFSIIQMSLLVNSSYEFIKTLFTLLSEMIFSIKSEDVYAYNKELNHIFYVIKVIFCDYVKVKKDICEIQKVDQIIELIYLGFEYDNDNKLSLKTACNILFLWGKLKLENDLVSKELTSTVFEKENNKQLMIKILCKIFTYMIEDNPIFLDLFEEFSQSTFILITLYPDAFIQLSNDIIQNSSLDQNEKQRMTMQFKELMNVYQNYDTFISSLINFQEKIKTLYQVVKEIILNHNRI